ncbi:MAG: hypothetical protein L0Y58_08170 [Verrucomicrobia subdivision 3 bacterium]|nr:hypothetical protein [Limisphaerales bacterium]
MAIAIALLVITACIAVIGLRPWESRVEHHKRALFSAGQTRWFDRVQDVWNSKRGRPPAWVQRTERHETALIELGYFERRTFELTNVTPAIAMQSIGTAAGKMITGPWRIRQASATSLVVAGAREDMALWEHLIRTADVPETK